MPLLGFLKLTEAKGAKERELEWEQRDDRRGRVIYLDLETKQVGIRGGKLQISRITPGKTAQKWANNGH